MDLDRQPEPDHALTVPFYPRFQPVLNQDSSHKKHSMQVFRGFHHPGIASACALTIGNFDGVHRGHQAMLALLKSEASHRGLPSCVMTFEPHPRDYFAAKLGKPELAPPRIALLRGVDRESAESVLDRLSQTLANMGRQQGRRLSWADGETTRPGRTAAQLEADLLHAIDAGACPSALPGSTAASSATMASERNVNLHMELGRTYQTP